MNCLGVAFLLEYLAALRDSHRGNQKLPTNIELIYLQSTLAKSPTGFWLWLIHSTILSRDDGGKGSLDGCNRLCKLNYRLHGRVQSSEFNSTIVDQPLLNQHLNFRSFLSVVAPALLQVFLLLSSTESNRVLFVEFYQFFLYIQVIVEKSRQK